MLYALLLVTAVQPAAAANEPCLDSLEPPSAPPLAANVHYGSLYDGEGGYEAAPLGIGRLALHGREDIWDWWHRIELPLFDGVEGRLKAWFVNGSLVETRPDSDEEESVTPVGTSGMIETGYETMSFIVVERREDWLRLRYAQPTDERDGLAWTPACRVEAAGLRFEPWEERFMSNQISVLTFRSEVAHALRAEPSVESDRRHWITGSHHLEPLEFRGDWMRVRVTEPSDYCASDSIEVQKREGWVRWRSEDKGPWVWYFTRGC